MAKLSIGDKARRVLDFNLGLRNPRVARALGAHGFTEKDLQEGWALLQQLTNDRLDLLPTGLDPRLLGELDAWENHWFPISEVVLRTGFPDVHAIIFRNLAQTEGAEVVVSVRTLLDRLDAMVKPTSEGGLGAKGKAAMKRLEKRGLKESVVAEARALLDQIGSLEPARDVPSDDALATREQAEQSLWNWYLEWSGIARVAIRDRRLLRSLGFLRTVRKTSGAVVDEVVTDEELDDTDEELDTDTPDVDEPPPVLTDPEPSEPAPPS